MYCTFWVRHLRGTKNNLLSTLSLSLALLYFPSPKDCTAFSEHAAVRVHSASAKSWCVSSMGFGTRLCKWTVNRGFYPGNVLLNGVY